MCGICGILHFDANKKINSEVIGRMNQTMIHRGPDDSGIYQNGSIGLAHRRLSIIDLDTGHQPMYNEDGSVCIVFNGEIYNHGELRKELQAKGHQFRTRSDTEAIIHCYEEYGYRCVDKLRGMFAFAVWDSNQQSLFLARDRLGIKPLYYYSDKDSFIFASEVKAIIASGYIKPQVNLRAIDAYVTLGYVPGPETLFSNIYKLLPAHVLRAQNGCFAIEEYWDFNSVPSQHMSESDCCETIREVLHECVQMRLMSDVPLGAFLSGGIDSSSVVAIMAQLLDRVETFSIGYLDAPEQNELSYAQIVAKQFGTAHHEFVLEPTNFFRSISELLFFLEEPIVEPSAIALFHISKLAREHATVLLSGEGADEIFGGYSIYRKMQILNYIRHIMPFMCNPFVMKVLLPLTKRSENVQKYLDWLSSPLERRYLGVSCDVTSSVKQNLYSDNLQVLSQSNMVGEIFQEYYDKVRDRDKLGKMLYVDAKIWLPDDLLIKADKMTMATSVELRVPFLDHKLVEFAASIPSSFKVKRRASKYILKKAMEGVLPNSVIYRKKRGFPVPVDQWFGSTLHEQAMNILLDSRSLQRGYFNRDYLLKVLDQQRTGRADHSRRIFSLLTLELWHEAFIDGDFNRALTHNFSAMSGFRDSLTIPSAEKK